MPAEISITDLLPALVDGKSAAVQAAWDQFFGNLCNVARNRLATGHVRGGDEEDVAASAFASVCRRLHRGDFPEIHDRDDLWRLLVTVAERKAYTMLRDEGRQKRGNGKISGESVFSNFDSSQAAGIQAIASAEPSPAFVTEMADTINRLFAALDEQGRKIALLKVEGYRNDEIARQIGRSIPTVERKLRLIREKWSALPEFTEDDPD